MAEPAEPIEVVPELASSIDALELFIETVRTVSRRPGFLPDRRRRTETDP